MDIERSRVKAPKLGDTQTDVFPSLRLYENLAVGLTPTSLLAMHGAHVDMRGGWSLKA